MCRVYLSGAIRGQPNGNWPLFAHYAKKRREQGHELFSPVENNLPEIREALKQDCDWICEHADAIAMLPGWETSRGARAEHALAQAIDGMKFIYL